MNGCEIMALLTEQELEASHVYITAHPGQINCLYLALDAGLPEAEQLKAYLLTFGPLPEPVYFLPSGLPEDWDAQLRKWD